MKIEAVKREDMIIATSLLCDVCSYRQETTNQVGIKFFKRWGWKKIDGKIACPECVEAGRVD